MKKNLWLLAVLAAVFIFTAVRNPNFLTPYNIENTLRWTSLFSILGIGAAFVIMGGGIDLSIGSTAGLAGTMLAWLLADQGWSTPVALLAVGGLSVLVGLWHGLLVSKLKLAPFIVTLCGLLLYRGIARYVTGDQTLGFADRHEGLRYLATGKPIRIGIEVPMPFLLMIAVAAASATLLHYTVFGRYLLAVGRNEQAARYSGINSAAVTIGAYVLCSSLSGFGGALFALDVNSVQPQGLGEFYELYAIAAAVLGGCSLRGGEGSILGVLVATALIRVLFNAINILGIPTQLDFAIIGIVILGGVLSDELIRRFVAARRQ